MAGAAELLPPVEYSSTLLVVALVLPLLVVGYYVVVTLRTRPPRRTPPAPAPPPPDARREALARLDEIEAATASGALPLRAAHQRLSEVVRGYAAQVGGADARALTLEQLRGTFPGELVDVVALVYPPEFAPGDEGSPATRLAPALRNARKLVTRWGP